MRVQSDYITKPFSVEELLARIRVSQRRLAITQSGKQPETSVFEKWWIKDRLHGWLHIPEGQRTASDAH